MHPAFIDIKEQFQKTPNRYYFMSATNFNLLDMHNWVNHWKDINFLDTYDQKAEHVLVPEERKHGLFESLEQIKLWKENSEHLVAQELGKEKWYEDYTVEIVEIISQYSK